MYLNSLEAIVMATGPLALMAAEEASIRSKLEAVGAVSPETAVTPQTAEISSGVDLSWLADFAKLGIVGKTEDGRYWWKQKTKRQQISVPVWPIMLFIVLGIVVYILWRLSVF